MIPFIDLQAQRRRLGGRMDSAIERVLRHGQFILGPEVGELETKLAAFAGARHAVSCSSGTDALMLVLMAWRIGPGDAVFVPAFTFAATAEPVALLGATPVFIDIRNDTFNMDSAALEPAIVDARKRGLIPRAVIPVDLFGQPADYPAIEPVARAHGLRILADAAQSFGASLYGKRVGGFGDATACSFFPAKPLGCYGDGGAVLTDDADLASAMRSLQVHGQGSNKYENVRIGLNARLDTLQAAVLLEKLSIFEEEIDLRQAVAERYGTGLGKAVQTPVVVAGGRSVWAQYTVRSPIRDRLAVRLKESGIPTAVYYPAPLTRQPAFSAYPAGPGGTPEAERVSREVLSLPMHPYLEPQVQERIEAAVRNGVEALSAA